MSGGPDAIRSLAALARGGQEPAPAAVAREFEALLASSLMRAAAKPLPGTRPLDGGSAARMWRERFFDEVARLAAARGGLGLAPAIERSLGAASPATEDAP